jgi:Xylose isomerase-like TIM barrel
VEKWRNPRLWSTTAPHSARLSPRQPALPSWRGCNRGLCSFLYWPYSLTDNDPARRARGLELARLMIEAAHELGTENLLTIAGSTYVPWIPEREPVPIEVCDRRAREAIGQLVPLAEKRGVDLNIENIVFNGYLTTPAEMNAFVDSFGSKQVRVHFDIRILPSVPALSRGADRAELGCPRSYSGAENRVAAPVLI